MKLTHPISLLPGLIFLVGVTLAGFIISSSSVIQARPLATEVIYDDVLGSGWEDWSWDTTVDYANGSPVQNGFNSMAVTYNAAWAGLYLHTSVNLNPADYSTLKFWLYGSPSASNAIKVQLYDQNLNEAGDPVNITSTPDAWTLFEIPLADFNFPAGSQISGIVWQERSGAVQPTFYMDDIILFNANDTPTPTPTITPTATPGPPPQHPFPQHVVYSPGSIKPNHRSQSQLDDDVRAFYDYWKSRYLVYAGTNDQGEPMYRVSYGDTNPDRTVSEGQGYGMVITAIMAGYDPQAQDYLDGLWRYARAHPSDVDPRLMGWQVPPDPNTGNDSAFDGDADMAYGLLLAHAQWGDGGAIDYMSEAQTLLAAIKESTIGPDSHLPELGDWVVDGDGDGYNQWTPRSSDFMLGHFRTWGRATGDEAFWDQVVAAVDSDIDGIQANYSPNTGLLPDFIVRESGTYNPQPAPPHFLEGEHDGDYDYNAGRDPWRLGTDALLNNDPTSFTQVQKMANWIVQSTNDNPANIKAGYTLDGVPTGDYFTSFFVSPFGVGVMTTPEHQTYLNNLYDLVYQRHEDYYEDSVTLLSLLVMTGNFWDPFDAPAVAPDDVTISLPATAPHLAWSHKTGNLSYQVWRSDAPYFDPGISGVLLDEVPAPGDAQMSYNDTTLPADATAYYQVRGVNRPGDASVSSNETGVFRFSLTPGAP